MVARLCSLLTAATAARPAGSSRLVVEAHLASPQSLLIFRFDHTGSDPRDRATEKGSARGVEDAFARRLSNDVIVRPGISAVFYSDACWTQTADAGADVDRLGRCLLEKAQSDPDRRFRVYAYPSKDLQSICEGLPVAPSSPSSPGIVLDPKRHNAIAYVVRARLPASCLGRDHFEGSVGGARTVVFMGIRPSAWNYARGSGFQRFVKLCKEKHASKNYAKLFELVQCGAGKEGGRGLVATVPCAETAGAAAGSSTWGEYLERGLFDFGGKAVLDLGAAKGWTEFAAISGAARRVVSIDGSDRALPPPAVSATAPEGAAVVRRVKWRVKDVIMALSCPPGKERSACMDVVRDALSDVHNPSGFADVVLGDLACNVRECGKVVSALALLLGDGRGGRGGLVVITVIGRAIGTEVMTQIRASGATLVSLVHLFASKKQERMLVARF